MTPYFDSLLKVCTHGATFETAIQKMERCLKEFRIRGVKTNIPFMLNVITHPEFQSGNAKQPSLIVQQHYLNFLDYETAETKR